MTTNAPAYVLALDLGTTGNRACCLMLRGAVVGQTYKELTQHYPQPGWLGMTRWKFGRGTCWAMQKCYKTPGCGIGGGSHQANGATRNLFTVGQNHRQAVAQCYSLSGKTAALLPSAIS